MAEWKTWGNEQVDAEERQLNTQSQMLKLTARPQPYTLRFLPAVGEEQSPFRIVFQHYWDKPDGTRSVVSCPYHMQNKAYCAVCERLKELSNTGNPVDAGLAKKAFPKTRVYSNVIDLEHPELGPQVFAFGKTIYDALVALRRNQHWGDFTDPENGYAIQVKVTGSGMDTEYVVTAVPNREAIEDFSWLDMKSDLTRFGTVLPPEEMERALMSLPSTPQYRQQQSGPPPRMAAAPSSRGALPPAAPAARQAVAPPTQRQPVSPAPATQRGRTIDQPAPTARRAGPVVDGEKAEGDDDDIPF